MKLLEFFQENNGKLSNMRLNCTMIVMTVCFIVIWPTIHATPDHPAVYAMELVTAMLAVAFAGKAYQKKVDNKALPEAPKP